MPSLGIVFSEIQHTARVSAITSHSRQQYKRRKEWRRFSLSLWFCEFTSKTTVHWPRSNHMSTPCYKHSVMWGGNKKWYIWEIKYEISLLSPPGAQICITTNHLRRPEDLALFFLSTEFFPGKGRSDKTMVSCLLPPWCLGSALERLPREHVQEWTDIQLTHRVPSGPCPLRRVPFLSSHQHPVWASHSLGLQSGLSSSGWHWPFCSCVRSALTDLQESLSSF